MLHQGHDRSESCQFGTAGTDYRLPVAGSSKVRIQSGDGGTKLNSLHSFSTILPILPRRCDAEDRERANTALGRLPALREVLRQIQLVPPITIGQSVSDCNKETRPCR
jgi:hypothetical protein